MKVLSKKCERCKNDAVKYVPICTSCGHTPEANKLSNEDLVGSLKMCAQIVRASNVYEDFVDWRDYKFISGTLTKAIEALGGK